MRWSSKRVFAAAAAMAAIGGGGAAYATTQSGAKARAPQAVKAETPFVTAVANRVGVSPQKLLDAMKAEATARVDTAAAAGRIPAEAAARIKARIAAATLDSPFGLAGPRPDRGGSDGRRGLRGLGGPHKQIAKVAADYIGATPDELRQELMSGKSLAQIATAHGKSVEGLKSAIVKALTERLDEAAANGRLTREAEQQILDRVKANLDDILNRTGPPGPRGRLLLPRM